MQDSEHLTDALEALIPKSLDDVIRRNRDAASLRLTTDKELFELYESIIPGPLKETIEDWRFISLQLQTPDRSATLTFLLGNRLSNGNPRITSDVIKVDLDRGLVVTKSGSLYKLGTKGVDQPPFEGLVMICSAFHSWGFGEALGIPNFYY